jgi:oligoribonuclease
MTPSADNLIWIDLEMTGLNPQKDRIIEIATIVTDRHLRMLEEGPVIAIRVSNAVLDAMDDWNIEHHTRSGLVERVRKSRYTTTAAERATLEFVRRYVPEKQSPMCGNSICQDRRFLARQMPELEGYFHYRNLDVSTIKILVNRWAPDREQFTKESTHRALDDARDAINELKFYREKYLKL